MRKYEENTGKILAVTCNQCGKNIEVRENMILEEVFNGNHVCGYFSKRDGIRDKFDLCEDCYEKFLKSFLIPVDSEEESELV